MKTFAEDAEPEGQVPVDPLEWAVIEALRSPYAEMFPPVVEIAGQVYNTCEPSEAQCVAVAAILRDLVARGLVGERPSVGPTYHLRNVEVEEAASPEEAVDKLIPQWNHRYIANAVVMLAELFPDMPAGKALARWAELCSGEAMLYIKNAANVLHEMFPHLEIGEAMEAWLALERRSRQ